MTSRWSTDPVVHDAVARLAAACRDFEPDREIARTGKSLVLGGDYLGTGAVAKVLIDHGEFWLSRFRNELAFFRTTSAAPVPVAIPQLFHGDEDLGILIIEYLDGRSLASSRYPESPIDDRAFALLLETLPHLHAWKPAPISSRRDVVGELESRLEKHVARGILPRSDADQARKRIQAATWDPVFSHRDLLLTNCLVLDDRSALIDWEYAGYAVPGYDEALLWVVLMDDAPKRKQLVHGVNAQGEERALLFTINAMSLLAREIHLLRTSGDDSLRLRAAKLEADLSQVRGWVRPR